MQPETAIARSSSQASIVGTAAVGRLRVAMQAGPLCLLPRVLDPEITDALDSIAPTELPTFDVSGRLNRVRNEVKAALAPSMGGASSILSWLRQDVLGLVELFAGAAGVDQLRVRLRVVEDDMCRKFHVDNVAFRLVTTYRGPGTEWISPRAVAEARSSDPILAGAIRSMERGEVAVMRGGKVATADQPGVVHRSPPIAKTGTVRLFLAINDIGAPVAVGGM